MQFNGRFNLKASDIIKKEHGITNMGRVQKNIDSNCIRYMSQYVPFVTGILDKAATIGTVIGSGKIVQAAPQARYLYYGMLMVSSLTGSAFASHGEKKVLTDKKLEYNQSNHQLAGPFWFPRMTADKKDEILKEAQQIANRGGK